LLFVILVDASRLKLGWTTHLFFFLLCAKLRKSVVRHGICLNDSVVLLGNSSVLLPVAGAAIVDSVQE
jgi:hypothetical protein